MDLIQIITLAILQGLTEFLPISSSAHLILVPRLLGWQDQGLAFDVAVHVGTLLAVLWYFKDDLLKLLSDCFHAYGLKQSTTSTNLAKCIIAATIPAMLIGYLSQHLIETYLRTTLVIASANIGFGFALWWADRKPDQNHTVLENITMKHALIIGIAQACALIPGSSRSGMTIMAALMLGFTRQAAARFSFLLSIPIIIAAGSLLTIELIVQIEPVDWLTLIIGSAISALSAYACIHLFLKLLDKIGMLPFVIYRMLLGIVLLWLLIPIN